MKRSGLILGGGLAFAAVVGFAQTQQQKPPIAVYWLSAETASGMPMGGGGMDIGSLMMGGMSGGARHELSLQLGSQRTAADPSANHRIPATMKMGDALPLVTPLAANVKPEREATTEGPPEDFKKPEGRMLIYWGCGEKTRPGQPLVVDFSKLTSAKAMPADLFALRISAQRPPSAQRNRGYGDWPNKENSTRVPTDASLVGNHVIAGNYSPEIRFGVDDRHDFLAPVSLDAATKTAGGGVTARWQSVPHALGYFATVVTATSGGKDIVMWSSSERRVFGDALMTWLPNADVARLISEKVVMPPQATECVVPAAVAGAGEGGMMRFIAYGEELNLAHPPRPADPKAVWEPEWAVKLRLKSTAMTMLGMEMPAGPTRKSGRRGDEGGGTDPARGESTAPANPPNPADAAIKEGTKALRGLFGF